MTLTKSLLETLALAVVAALLSAVFYHVGALSIATSILLGICFTVVAAWLCALWLLAAFKPYGVEIYVNFDALRRDLGLCEPDSSRNSDEPAYEINVFTAINAFVFAHYRSYTAKTALELNITANRLDRTDEGYRSAIAFGDQIPCIFKSEQIDIPENRNPHPKFLFSPGRGGYQFVLQVAPAWWAEHKKSLSAQIRDLPIGHNEEIVLATLPYGYVPNHVRRWNQSTSLFYPFDLKQRRWKSRLTKLGWSIHDDDLERLDHRYLSISYWNI